MMATNDRHCGIVGEARLLSVETHTSTASTLPTWGKEAGRKASPGGQPTKTERNMPDSNRRQTRQRSARDKFNRDRKATKEKERRETADNMQRLRGVRKNLRKSKKRLEGAYEKRFAATRLKWKYARWLRNKQDEETKLLAQIGRTSDKIRRLQSEERSLKTKIPSFAGT